MENMMTCTRHILLVLVGLATAASTPVGHGSSFPVDSDNVEKLFRMKKEVRQFRTMKLNEWFSTDNVEKLFAHFDKDRNGELTPAEQDDLLDDIEKISTIDLPDSFKKVAKVEHGMTFPEFKQTYFRMKKEFKQVRTEKMDEWFSTDNVLKLFAHFDKDRNGKLTPAEQDDLLDDLEEISAIDLPNTFKKMAKVEHDMTFLEFKQTYFRMKKEFKQVRTRELNEWFSNDYVEKLFAHFDKDRSGKLTPAEQDDLLDDLKEISAIDLPDTFKKMAKVEHDMTFLEFKQTYFRLKKEFKQVWTMQMNEWFSTDNIEKLFAHYDKYGNGKLMPAEQDDLLSDLEEISAVNLPDSFKKTAKVEHDMTFQEFKQTYLRMKKEFRQFRTMDMKGAKQNGLKLRGYASRANKAGVESLIV